jgi:hypothetical protein
MRPGTGNCESNIRADPTAFCLRLTHAARPTLFLAGTKRVNIKKADEIYDAHLRETKE